MRAARIHPKTLFDSPRSTTHVVASAFLIIVISASVFAFSRCIFTHAENFTPRPLTPKVSVRNRTNESDIAVCIFHHKTRSLGSCAIPLWVRYATLLLRSIFAARALNVRLLIADWLLEIQSSRLPINGCSRCGLSPKWSKHSPTRNFFFFAVHIFIYPISKLITNCTSGWQLLTVRGEKQGTVFLREAE